MRRFSLTAMVVIAAYGLLASVSWAETASPCGVMATGVAAGGPSPKVPVPFSATVQTTKEQRFVDGNAIHGQIVTHQYRDSAGRTRSETSGLCNIGLDGQLHPTINVTVVDPVAHTVLSWQINGRDKVARLRHQSDGQANVSSTPLTDEQRKLNALMQQYRHKNTRSEKLGTRTIAGLNAEGTRQITTSPPGEQGNELAMELIEEYWMASDPQMVMLRSEESPSTGRTTTEVTELTLAEPDASLFAPPAGYTLEEQPAKLVSSSAGQ